MTKHLNNNVSKYFPKEKIQVGFIDPPEKNEIEEKESKERHKILDSIRIPLFCPKCNQLMNKRFDKKMYYIHQMCFDCAIEMETKMRIDGTYNEYEKNKIHANKIAYFKYVKQQIEEYLEQLEHPITTVINEYGDIDTWTNVTHDNIKIFWKNELDKINDLLEKHDVSQTTS